MPRSRCGCRTSPLLRPRFGRCCPTRPRARGGEFHYDPGRFAALTAVAQACSQKSFRENFSDSMLERLGMASSVPGQDLGTPTNPARQFFDPPQLERYAGILGRMAVPYRVDRSGRATRSDYAVRGLNAADGLVSTARDLARFDAALDEHVLLTAETLSVAWSQVNYTGTPLPTGIGWFVQNYQNEKLIWQFATHHRRLLGDHPQDAGPPPDVDHAGEQRRPQHGCKPRGGRRHPISVREDLPPSLRLGS